MSDSAQIVIVGAGPVGLSTALLLAKWGLPSVVIEAKYREDFRPGSKAVGMQRDAMDIFRRIGCAADMMRAGDPLGVSQTHYGSRVIREQKLDVGSAAMPPDFLQIAQCETELFLLRLADESSLINVRFGERLRNLERVENGVDLALLNVERGEETHLLAEYVVGADGANSTVRELAEFDFPGWAAEERFLILDVSVDDRFLDRLQIPAGRHFYFNPPWAPQFDHFLMSPQPNGVWRMDWPVQPSFSLEEARESGELAQLVRDVVGHDEFVIDWASVYSFHQRCADTFRSDCIFLAGDAAHRFAPFGGRGMNSGMFDAENLAWKLALATRLPSGSVERETVLDSYTVERRAAALENLGIVEETMRFLLPADEEGREAKRRILEDALVNPNEAIQSGNLSTPAVYPDAGLTRSQSFAEAASGSWLAPDFACEVHGFPEVQRFRELVGPHVLVVTNDMQAGNLVDKQTGRALDLGLIGHLPIRHISIADFADPVAAAAALGVQAQHERCVVRPDGYVVPTT